MKNLFFYWCLGLALALSFGKSLQSLAADEADRSGTRSNLLAEESTDRKISASDIIIVDVFGEKDLSGEHRVQATGIIKFPLIGTVEVAGKTPAQVADMLQQKLEADYLVEPQVNVMVKEYRARTVTVIGKVNREGAVDLPAEQRIDILEGVARAGGFDRQANKNKIELSRNGKSVSYKFDDLVKKKVWLEPGDVVYVHEAFF